MAKYSKKQKQNFIEVHENHPEKSYNECIEIWKDKYNYDKEPTKQTVWKWVNEQKDKITGDKKSQSSEQNVTGNKTGNKTGNIGGDSMAGLSRLSGLVKQSEVDQVSEKNEKTVTAGGTGGNGSKSNRKNKEQKSNSSGLTISMDWFKEHKTQIAIGLGAFAIVVIALGVKRKINVSDLEGHDTNARNSSNNQNNNDAGGGETNDESVWDGGTA